MEKKEILDLITEEFPCPHHVANVCNCAVKFDRLSQKILDYHHPKTAKELRAKLEKDLKELQDQCPHTNSKWMNHEWAPGHCSGVVKVCNCCDKILKRK